jgi:hypothetical protein
MAGKIETNSLELGRAWLRRTSRWSTIAYGVGLFTALFAIVLYGLVLYIDMSPFGAFVAPVLGSKYFPLYIVGAAVAVFGAFYLVANNNKYNIPDNVWIALFWIAFYIGGFSTYELLVRDLFHVKILNQDLWAVWLGYPVAGAFILAVLFFLTVYLILIINSATEKVSRVGPSVPPIIIFYAVVVVLVLSLSNWFGMAFEGLISSEISGLSTIVVLLLIFFAFVVLPHVGPRLKLGISSRSPISLVFSAIVYWLRCLASVIDVLLADSLARLFTDQKSPWLRYPLIILAFAVPSALMLIYSHGIGIPFTKITIPSVVMTSLLIVPGAVAIGIYRRSAWLEDERQKCLRSSDDECAPNSRMRVTFHNDLKVELLLTAALLFFLTAPATVWFLNNLYDLYIFDSDRPASFWDWVGFFGSELRRDIPLIEWFHSAYGHEEVSKFKPTELGRHVSFVIRILTEFSIIAILFQTLDRSSNEARQREEFLDIRDSVNRLDPIDEHELFIEVQKDKRTVERVSSYDPLRLEKVVTRIFDLPKPDMVECVGAARIAGYQLAGTVIAKILRAPVYTEGSRDLDRIWWTFRDAPSERTYRKGNTQQMMIRRNNRNEIIDALLDGMEIRLAKKDGVAPDTGLAVQALKDLKANDKVEVSNALELQLEGLTRANRIDFLVKDLTSDDYDISNAASEELSKLVNPKDVKLYTDMLNSETARVWNEGASLLGLLGPDIDNEKRLLEKLTNIPGKAPHALLRALSGAGADATLNVIVNMDIFSDKQGQTARGDENYIIAVLTGIVSRRADLQDLALDFVKPLLQSKRPMTLRVAAIVAMSFLYKSECDQLLLDCAWQGFCGRRDERSPRIVRTEHDKMYMLRVEAMKALAQSEDPDVTVSIKDIIDNLKQEQDMPTHNWVSLPIRLLDTKERNKRNSIKILIQTAQDTIKAQEERRAASQS